MTDHEEELRQRAHERMKDMPAETALGNPDPAGGSTEDPKVIDEEAREKRQQ
jgi:selenocysteine lyase/cysteine desulfurase